MSSDLTARLAAIGITSEALEVLERNSGLATPPIYAALADLVRIIEHERKWRLRAEQKYDGLCAMVENAPESDAYEVFSADGENGTRQTNRRKDDARTAITDRLAALGIKSEALSEYEGVSSDLIGYGEGLADKAVADLVRIIEDLVRIIEELDDGMDRQLCIIERAWVERNEAERARDRHRDLFKQANAAKRNWRSRSDRWKGHAEYFLGACAARSRSLNEQIALAKRHRDLFKQANAAKRDNRGDFMVTYLYAFEKGKFEKGKEARQ